MNCLCMRGFQKLFFVVVLLAISQRAFAQDETAPADKTFSLNGYLKFLQTVRFQEIDEAWLTDNIFHNRLNLKWYPGKNLTVTAELRTRFFYGESVKMIPQYPDYIDTQTGYVADLSGIVAEGGSYFIHTVLDRINVDWSKEAWQVRLGRQRINWGQTFVWNPNDVFNAYSFFDFDYEERPGSDALLIRRYTGATSSVEFAAAFARRWEDYRLAALYRWNRDNYDFQVLAGKVLTDYAIGGGWSGQIQTAGFRGEITWLEPIDKVLSGNGALVTAMSGDYTFPNSLFVHSEIIYNSHARELDVTNLALDFLVESRSPKTLTFSEWSWFNEASYPITPLLKAGVYTIYYPDERSVFLGPNVELSISDNVYLLFLGQFFVGSESSPYGNLGYFNYLRLKWSF